MSKKLSKKLISLLSVTLFSTTFLFGINTLSISAADNTKLVVENLYDGIPKDEDISDVDVGMTKNDIKNIVANLNKKPQVAPNNHQKAIKLTDEEDDTVVNFPDPILNAKIRTAFGLTDGQELTVGQIKSTTSFGGISAGSWDDPVSDFSGMEYLQLLPADIKFPFTANFGSNPIDFSKLSGIRLSVLNLTGDFINTDVSGLTTIPTDSMTQIILQGDGSRYQQNTQGLQNSQLETIGPWLTSMYNNDISSFKNISIANSSISDFSPLEGLDKTRDGWLISLGNNIQDADTIYVVDNDVNQVQANKILGIDGENINDDFNSTYNIGADNYKSRDLKALGGGKYEYDPLAMIPDTNFITYGYFGFQYDSTNKFNSYLEKDYSGDGTGLTFKFDGMVFRKVDVLEAPEITIKYADQSGKEIQADEVIQGQKIGDEFDLTDKSTIKGYTLVSPTDLTGKYTQDPQIITLTYKSSGNTGGGSGSGGSNVDRDIKDSIQYVATYSDQPDVDLFNINGNRITTRGLAKNSDWYSDKIMTLNGVKYYRVSTDEWVKASDVHEYTPKSGQVGTYNTTKNNQPKGLINAHVKVLNKALAAGTDWLYDRTAEFDGQTYHRVATNEFVKADDVYDYQPIKGTVTTTDQVSTYNEAGELGSRALLANTSWNADRKIEIDGSDYYRISADEYVKASDVSFK